MKFQRPSLLFFYLQYLLIYVPASFLVYTSTRPKLTDSDAFILVVAMFASLTLIQLVYTIPLIGIRATRISPSAFWLIVGSAVAVFLVYLGLTLGRNFRLVNFEDVYSVRSAMAEIVTASGGRFGLYAQSILAAVFLPLAFATGVTRRRVWLIALVALSYVFLFGIGGAKANALALAYLPFGAALLGRRSDRIGVYLAVGLAAALLTGYVTEVLLPRQAQIEFLAVVHFRLFTVPPLTIPQYFEFFQTHPVTHLSHVTGLNALLRYPYDLDIPYTLGLYYYDGPLGANSGMWAGDGLAGFGIWGMPLVSAISAVVFWVFDSASVGLRPRYVALVALFCTVYFENVSLFTTLITGGLALVIVLMLLAPRAADGTIASPRFPRFHDLSVGQPAPTLQASADPTG